MKWVGPKRGPREGLPLIVLLASRSGLGFGCFGVPSWGGGVTYAGKPHDGMQGLAA